MQSEEIYDVYVYHQRLAPSGKIIRSDELAQYYGRGWVDTPAKFGHGIRGWTYSAIDYFTTWSRVELMTLGGLIIATISIAV